MSVIWSVLALGITALITRNRRSSIIVGLVVLSHWVLDFISHPMYPETDADLPLLFAGSPKVGLGLWHTHGGYVVGEAVSVGLGLVLLVYDLRRAARLRQERAR